MSISHTTVGYMRIWGAGLVAGSRRAGAEAAGEAAGAALTRSSEASAGSESASSSGSEDSRRTPLAVHQAAAVVSTLIEPEPEILWTPSPHFFVVCMSGMDHVLQDDISACICHASTQRHGIAVVRLIITSQHGQACKSGPAGSCSFQIAPVWHHDAFP